MSQPTRRPTPFINLKHLNLLSILLLVNVVSSTPVTSYECLPSCTCNELTSSAKCSSLDDVVIALSNSQLKNRLHNYLPLQSLDLSNNQLTKLSNHLELLSNLTTLDASFNQLTQVHKLHFRKLEKLDLSHNKINSAKLAKLPSHIVHLNLSHNEITSLPISLMKLKKLKTLELNGNPIDCTCDTLHVRNWLTSRNVWSDEHIKCMSPLILKGKPWLAAKQTEICHAEMLQRRLAPNNAAKYDWDNYDDENELMQADDPNSQGYEDYESSGEEPFGSDDEDAAPKKSVHSDSTLNNTDDDDYDTAGEGEGELEKDALLPVQTRISTEAPAAEHTIVEEDPDDSEEKDEEDEEEEEVMETPAVSEKAYVTTDGSGDEEEPAVTKESSSIYDEDDYDDEGSGSGGGILISLPNVPVETPSPAPESNEEPEIIPTLGGLGIFEPELSSTQGPINRAGQENADDSENVHAAVGGETHLPTSEVNKAATDDNNGTYILLAILAIGLISLIIFVAMKNHKSKKKNRHDIENIPPTELQDMDKKLLGKPKEQNGNGNGQYEHIPLIDREKPNGTLNGDKPNVYTTFHPPAITLDEPILKKDTDKSQQSLYENVPKSNGNPSTNGSVPERDEEAFFPAESDLEPNNNETNGLAPSPAPAKRYSPIYNPASPRSDRYSPVYSPETGRVKIKLTETPRSKTPIMVNRSRSKAGDYVNTPVEPNQNLHQHSDPNSD